MHHSDWPRRQRGAESREKKKERKKEREKGRKERASKHGNETSCIKCQIKTSKTFLFSTCKCVRNKYDDQTVRVCMCVCECGHT